MAARVLRVRLARFVEVEDVRILGVMEILHLELIATRTPHPQPEGVDWDKVRPDQFTDIPFLSALRHTIERRKRTT